MLLPPHCTRQGQWFVPLSVHCAHGHLRAVLSGQKPPGRSRRSILALDLPWVWTPWRFKRWGLSLAGQCTGTRWSDMGDDKAETSGQGRCRYLCAAVWTTYQKRAPAYSLDITISEINNNKMSVSPRFPMHPPSSPETPHSLDCWSLIFCTSPLRAFLLFFLFFPQMLSLTVFNITKQITCSHLNNGRETF